MRSVIGRRPARVGGDTLRLRLDRLCDLASGSIEALRELDLGSPGADEAFGQAVRGLMDAAYYSQGIGEALAARLAFDAAAQALLMMCCDEWTDEGSSVAPKGLPREMYAEAQRKLAGAMGRPVRGKPAGTRTRQGAPAALPATVEPSPAASGQQEAA